MVGTNDYIYDVHYTLTQENLNASFTVKVYYISNGYAAPGSAAAKYTAGSISGFINGQTISGLSNFNNADNKLFLADDFRGHQIFHVDQNGLSFLAGNVDYSLVGDPPKGIYGPINREIFLTSSRGESYTLHADGTSSTLGNCFTTGTSIRTACGNILVEDLRVGDTVITSSGKTRAITWIGRRDMDAPSAEQCPVRILAGAFGPCMPTRELRLSPGHPVLVGQHLVPIMCLINGTSVARTSVDQVTYWHVEVDGHDILLANGLPCESYFDTDMKAWFTGLSVPPSDHTATERCLPVASSGPVVEAERRRLDGIFVAMLDAQCQWQPLAA